jgi:molybdate transport system substrate-binding protein
VILRLATLLLLLPAIWAPAVAATVRVAVTGDQRSVITEVAEAYKQAHPRDSVEIRSDAAGKLYASIKAGTQVDLFIGLDRHYPERLIKNALAVEPVLHFASNPLVLWAANRKIKLQGLESLADEKIRFITYANPEFTISGRRAEEALKKGGVWGAVQGKILTATSVEQAGLFARIGNADVAIIPVSTAHALNQKNRGLSVDIPRDLQGELDTCLVLTTHGNANPAAHSFAEFLQGPKAREILRAHGLGEPTYPTPTAPAR